MLHGRIKGTSDKLPTDPTARFKETSESRNTVIEQHNIAVSPCSRISIVLWFAAIRSLGIAVIFQSSQFILRFRPRYIGFNSDASPSCMINSSSRRIVKLKMLLKSPKMDLFILKFVTRVRHLFPFTIVHY